MINNALMRHLNVIMVVYPDDILEIEPQFSVRAALELSVFLLMR